MTCVLRLSPFWHGKCKSTVTDATSGAGREAKGAGECATLPAAPVTVETVRSPSTPRLRLPSRTRRCNLAETPLQLRVELCTVICAKPRSGSSCGI